MGFGGATIPGQRGMLALAHENKTNSMTSRGGGGGGVGVVVMLIGVGVVVS